jgi:hypothetical protein
MLLPGTCQSVWPPFTTHFGERLIRGCGKRLLALTSCFGFVATRVERLFVGRELGHNSPALASVRSGSRAAQHTQLGIAKGQQLQKATAVRVSLKVSVYDCSSRVLLSRSMRAAWNHMTAGFADGGLTHSGTVARYMPTTFMPFRLFISMLRSWTTFWHFAAAHHPVVYSAAAAAQ